jgi:hypothetical protein
MKEVPRNPDLHEVKNAVQQSSRQGVDLPSTFRGSVCLPQMFPHPNFLVMLPKQLPADHILVLCDDTNQSIHIFGMVPNQFGQPLDLSL